MSHALPVALLAVSILSVLAAVAAVVHTHRKTKRTLSRMNAMLDAAIRGDFSESLYDESLLSAVEARLSRYLAASAISNRNLTEERNKIKELIADISHQTKTPIANLLLYAELLNEQALPSESRAYVAALNAQAEKLRFLIGSLVKVSRLEAGVFALTPAQTAVWPMPERLMAEIAPKADGKGVTVAAEPTDIAACFDEKWTAEALGNLLDNAVKYTPAGGAVRLTVHRYELFVRIDVADSGIGIAESEQADIFRRFYRSPVVSGTEGVGIGLYLARRIVALQGGYIKVSSAAGSGATFSVFLPAEARNLAKP